MTDNKIVKALEGISYHLTATKHKEAIYEALDLINRQKAEIEKNENIIRLADKTIETANAEIERLKTNLNIELENYATEYDNKIKAEAYREFAERLHEELRMYGIKDKFNKSVFLNVVDKAKKELVGEDDG